MAEAEPRASSRIFISYRREETMGFVRALLEPLRARFGRSRVFKGDNISPGEDFVKAIERELESCKVLLVVIGNEWTVQDARTGKRQLDNPSDTLRIEVAAALSNKQITVIPVLVDRAEMPSAEDLPDDLSDLARRNAFELNDARWDSDVERLLRAIDEICAAVPQPHAEADDGGFERLELKRKRQLAEHLEAARAAFDAEDHQAALAACGRAVWLDPQNPEARDLATRAQAAIDQKNIQQRLDQAARALADGDLAAASEAIDGALARSPDHPRAIKLRQDLLRARGLEESSTQILSADGNLAGGPTTPPLDENVQFTVYRPAEIEPSHWYSLLAFVHLAERRPDEPDSPDPIKEVQEQAERLLGQDLADYQGVASDSLRAIPRSGELTLEPDVDGIEFNPARYSFRWEQSVHRAEFQLRCRPGPAPRIARGRLTIFWGALIVGDVPLAIRVVAHAGKEVARAPADVGRPYRNIFASYSRRDVTIVEQFDEILESLGDRYLRDVRDLRAGEVWSDELRGLITRADVFQLFWSWNALASPFVRQEWEFALGLQRANFVRPVYWEEPLPSRGDLPPEALRRLHFHQLGSVKTGPPGWEAPRPSSPSPVSPTGSYPMPVPQAPPEFNTSARQRMPSPAGVGRVARWKANLTAAAAISVLTIGSVTMWRMATDRAPSTDTPPPSISSGQPVPPPQNTTIEPSPGLTGGAVSRGTNSGPAGRGGVPGLPQANAQPSAGGSPKPPPTAGQPVDDVTAIKGLLARYADAYNTLDERRVRAIVPSFSGFPDRSSLRAVNVTFQEPQISVKGRSATLVATAIYRYEWNRPGLPASSQGAVKWLLQKDGVTWKVVSSS